MHFQLKELLAVQRQALTKRLLNKPLELVGGVGPEGTGNDTEGAALIDLFLLPGGACCCTPRAGGSRNALKQALKVNPGTPSKARLGVGKTRGRKQTQSKTGCKKGA